MSFFCVPLLAHIHQEFIIALDIQRGMHVSGVNNTLYMEAFDANTLALLKVNNGRQPAPMQLRSICEFK
jgi:hypothetical protein